MQVGTISMDIYSTETNIFSVFGLNSVNFLSIPLLSIFQNSLNKKLNWHPPLCSWYNIYPWSFYQTVGPRSGQPLAPAPVLYPGQSTDRRQTYRQMNLSWRIVLLALSLQRSRGQTCPPPECSSTCLLVPFGAIGCTLFPSRASEQYDG